MSDFLEKIKFINDKMIEKRNSKDISNNRIDTPIIVSDIELNNKILNEIPENINEESFISNLSNNSDNSDKIIHRKRAKTHLSYFIDEYNNLFKIIIPFDFEEKKYSIDEIDYDFFSDKEYIAKKISQFNNNRIFSIDYRYKLSFIENILYIIPNIICTILTTYVLIYVIVSTIFNIGIIFISFYLIYLVNFKIGKIKFNNLEKMRLKELEDILDKENNTDKCSELSIKWMMGKNGYWLEIHKI